MCCSWSRPMSDSTVWIQKKVQLTKMLKRLLIYLVNGSVAITLSESGSVCLVWCWFCTFIALVLLASGLVYLSALVLLASGVIVLFCDGTCLMNWLLIWLLPRVPSQVLRHSDKAKDNVQTLKHAMINVILVLVSKGTKTVCFSVLSLKWHGLHCACWQSVDHWLKISD